MENLFQNKSIRSEVNWHAQGESNPSYQDENLVSYPIDDGRIIGLRIAKHTKPALIINNKKKIFSDRSRLLLNKSFLSFRACRGISRITSALRLLRQAQHRLLDKLGMTVESASWGLV